MEWINQLTVNLLVLVRIWPNFIYNGQVDEFMIQHFIFYVLSVIKDYLGVSPFMQIFGIIGIETVEWKVVL